METKETLTQLGLGQKQASVLLASLELGPASISDLARRSGVGRTSIYHLIEQVIRKGYIRKTPRGKRVFYVAVPPRIILNVLEERRRKFEKILPHLEGLHASAGINSRVEFYEGKEGVIDALKNLFTTHKNIYSILSFESLFNVINHEDNREIFRLLGENGGELYALTPYSPRLKEILTAEYRKGLSRERLLPEDFKIHVEILAVGDRIAYLSFTSQVAVIIQDADIADAHRQLHKYIWKSAKSWKKR